MSAPRREERPRFDIDPSALVARHPMETRRPSDVAPRPLARLALVFATLALLLVGCGPTVLTLHATPAARRLTQAEEAGAAEIAPYEYHYARENLREARASAAAARWQDAIKYAEFAEEYANRALELCRERRTSR